MIFYIVYCTCYFRHDIEDILDNLDDVSTLDKKDLRNKGFVSKSCFKALVRSQNDLTNLTDSEIWNFFVMLNLATEIKELAKEPHSLYIPSIINDKNEQFIKHKLEEFNNSENSLGFCYSLHKCDKATQLYSILLAKLADKSNIFSKKTPGISFERSYSAKIEHRPLGLVAGACGTLKWKHGQSSIQNIDFLVLDYDSNIKDNIFSRQKVVSYFLTLKLSCINEYFSGHQGSSKTRASGPEDLPIPCHLHF